MGLEDSSLLAKVLGWLLILLGIANITLLCMAKAWIRTAISAVGIAGVLFSYSLCVHLDAVRVLWEAANSRLVPFHPMVKLQSLGPTSLACLW